jgi:hypothetical protein
MEGEPHFATLGEMCYAVGIEEGVMRKLLLGVFLLAGCALGRAEDRAIAHALSIGFVNPRANCDAVQMEFPDYRLCDVQQTEPEVRGIAILCPDGLEDKSCIAAPPTGEIGISGGKF